VKLAVAIAAAAFGGCTWVYDAQYGARADQLEKSRQLFLPGSAQVQFITNSDHKLYWVDVQMPQNVQILHSYDPATTKKIDYTFPPSSTISASTYHMSDNLIVSCGSPIVAFDATQPSSMIDMSQTGGSSLCAVTNTNVYFISEDTTSQHVTINQWTPHSTPTQVADLNTVVPNGSSSDIAGLGIIGNLIVMETSVGALWTYDVSAARLTWLMNPDGGSGTNGTVAFDDQGVAFVASGNGTPANPGGATFSRYADKTATPIEKSIDNGGYDLNFEHSDIQQLDTDINEYTLTQHHLVYRSKSGIFAYGFDTTKVIDLLLDRKATDYGSKPYYRSPTIAGSVLFVQDLGDSGGAGDRPVYSVDLTDRLR
jgi:hypothetical protein